MISANQQPGSHWNGYPVWDEKFRCPDTEKNVSWEGSNHRC